MISGILHMELVICSGSTPRRVFFSGYRNLVWFYLQELLATGSADGLFLYFSSLGALVTVVSTLWTMANDTETLDPIDTCTETKWKYFLASSLITFGAGLFLILLYKFIVFVFCHGKSSQRKSSVITPNPMVQKESSKDLKDKSPGFFKGHDPEVGWLTEAKDWAGELISGQTTTGRILVR